MGNRTATDSRGNQRDIKQVYSRYQKKNNAGGKQAAQVSVDIDAARSLHHLTIMDRSSDSE